MLPATYLGSHKQHVSGLCHFFLSKDPGLAIRPVEVTGELDACAVCAEVRVRVSVRPSGVDVVNLGKPSRMARRHLDSRLCVSRLRCLMPVTPLGSGCGLSLV